ncbi:MAG: hypothetical protein ACLVHV_01905 [Oscillospiraceae bacterium]
MGATAPDPITPSKIGSTVQYDQIRDGVSLQYMVTGYHVKESIVIEKPQSSYSFQFRMQLTNLTPDMQEDGSILFHNQDGDSVYEIPAPYMIDAGLNMSDQVSYTLRMVSETCYDLLVQADAAWINGEERSFPVVIRSLPDRVLPEQLQLHRHRLHPLRSAQHGRKRLPAIPGLRFRNV